MIDLSQFKNIAVIQTAFLGDVVLSLPMIQTIRNSNPSAEVSLITTPAASAFGYLAKAADKVISYDKRGLQSGIKGIRYIAGLLKENGTDCIFGLHRSLRSSLITYFVKPEFSVGFRNASLSLVYKKRVKYPVHYHEIDRDLELLSVFSGLSNICSELKDVELVDLDEEMEYVEFLLQQKTGKSQRKIIAVAPGSVWPTKRWHKDHFAGLCGLLLERDFLPVLTGSEQDAPLCEEIAKDSGAISIAGETSLSQTVAFLRKSELLVTNDSAPTHFAGLAGCKCITIFGPTSPIFGFAPRGLHDISLHDDSLECSPCRIHGSKKCPVGTHECMTNIKPDMVYASIVDVLEK